MTTAVAQDLVARREEAIACEQGDRGETRTNHTEVAHVEEWGATVLEA